MANLADLDPSFSVPCRRCASMLQKGNRFCPFCFEDQFAERDAGDAAPPVAAVAEARKTGRVVIDFEDTAQPGAEEFIQIPGPAGASAEEPDPGIGLVRPGVFSQMELPPVGADAPRGARFATPRRLVIGIAGALVLVAVGFGLRRAYFEFPAEGGRLQADGVHAALKHGAEPPHQTLTEPAVDIAPVPSVLPDAPVVIEPSAAESKAAVTGNGCSEALAALALCPGK